MAWDCRNVGPIKTTIELYLTSLTRRHIYGDHAGLGSSNELIFGKNLEYIYVPNEVEYG